MKSTRFSPNVSVGLDHCISIRDGEKHGRRSFAFVSVGLAGGKTLMDQTPLAFGSLKYEAPRTSYRRMQIFLSWNPPSCLHCSYEIKPQAIRSVEIFCEALVIRM